LELIGTVDSRQPLSCGTTIEVEQANGQSSWRLPRPSELKFPIPLPAAATYLGGSAVRLGSVSLSGINRANPEPQSADTVMPPSTVNAIGDLRRHRDPDAADASEIEPRAADLAPDLVARLHIRSAQGATAIKDVLRPTTLVGAMGQCNIQLVAPGVAPAHCVITFEAGGLWVYDLRSRSGTWLNDRRVDSASLGDKDLLRMGGFECRVETNLPHRVDAFNYAGSTARMHITSRDGRCAVKDILRPATLVGALPGCNIQLVDPGISLAHCLITLHAGRLRVRDLRTAQGSWLDSQAVVVWTLGDGSTLEIGCFSARVETNLERTAWNLDDQLDTRFRDAKITRPMPSDRALVDAEPESRDAVQRDCEERAREGARLEADRVERIRLTRHLDADRSSLVADQDKVKDHQELRRSLDADRIAVEQDRQRLDALARTRAREQEQFDGEVAAARRDREQIAADRAALRQEQEQFDGEVAAVRQDREQIAADRAALRQEKAALEARTAECRRDQEQLNADRVLLEQDRTRLDALAAEWGREKEQFDSQVAVFQSDRECLAKSRQELAARERNLADALRALESHRAELAALQSVLQAERSTLIADRETNERRLAELAVALVSQESALDMRAAEQARTQAELEERCMFVSEQEQSAQSAVREAAAEREGLQSDRAEFNALREALNAERDALLRRNRETEQAAQELCRSLVELDERRRSVEDQRGNLERERVELRDEGTGLRARETELQERQAGVERRSAEIETFAAKLESRQADLAKLQVANEEDRQQLEFHRRELEEAKAGFDRECAAAEREGRRLTELEQALTTREDRLTADAADLSTRQIELTATAEQIEAERNELGEWASQLHERETFVRTARKQFQATLEEFRAEQRRFRMACVAIKAGRERTRRRRESAALVAEDRVWAQRLHAEGILNDAQANWFIHGRFGDFVAGTYQIAELLSLGNSEWIYEVKDLASGNRFALKAVGRALAANADAARRLEREARLGGVVNHSNVVRTWSFSKSEDGAAYLVMELVEGITLGELIALHGELPWSEVCNYVFQASIGLQQLHEAGLVHRDVQPWNLLIEHNGGLKVADFGEASAAFLADPASERGGDCPIPGPALDYAAPELLHTTALIGPQADVYSLGCVFYHALTGSVPFPDRNATEKSYAHRALPPQPIRSHVSRVPSEVIGIVKKMMAKDPQSRLSSMNDVSRALAGLARRQYTDFDQRVILAQRAIAARSKLRAQAQRIAECGQSIEPTV
jgi:pSer/pThr/pTyr-binding forkhead associated (FHA) protein